MVKIQIDLSDDENQMLEMYKVATKSVTKEQALKLMVKSVGKPLLDAVNKKRIPLAFGTLNLSKK